MVGIGGNIGFMMDMTWHDIFMKVFHTYNTGGCSKLSIDGLTIKDNLEDIIGCLTFSGETIMTGWHR